MCFFIIPDEYIFKGIDCSSFKELNKNRNNTILKKMCDKYKNTINYTEMSRITLFKIVNKELESRNFESETYSFKNESEMYNFIDDKLNKYKLYIYSSYIEDGYYILRLFIKNDIILKRNKCIDNILE